VSCEYRQELLLFEVLYVIVNTAVCFTLTSTICRSLGYNLTGFPNVFGQTDQASANSLLATLMFLNDKQCSDDIEVFACAAAFPQCINSARLLYPCRDFCLGEFTVIMRSNTFNFLSLPSPSVGRL